MNPTIAIEVRWTQWLRLRWLALRAFSFPVSVLPVFAAFAAVRPVRDWPVATALAVPAAVLCLHAVGNLLNDYFDYRYGVDHRARESGRPGRLLVDGLLAPRDVLLLAAGFLAAALALIAFLLWRCGWGPVLFGGAGLAGAYAYTGAPFRLKHRGLGEPAILLVFGPMLMCGAAWCLTGGWEPRALLLSIPVGMATTAVLFGNNLRDAAEDADAGIRTLGGITGPRWGGVLYAALVLGALAGVALYGLGFGPPLLMAAPLLAGFHARPLAAVLRGERLPDIDARTARFETVLLLFVLVVLLSGAQR